MPLEFRGRLEFSLVAALVQGLLTRWRQSWPVRKPEFTCASVPSSVAALRGQRRPCGVPCFSVIPGPPDCRWKSDRRRWQSEGAHARADLAKNCGFAPGVPSG